MTTPNADHFPNNIGVIAADLTTPGAETRNLFEPREAVIRSLLAYNFLSGKRNVDAPGAPSKWDIWIEPGALENGLILHSDIKIFNGTAWVDISPSLFARAILEKGGGAALPADAVGYLHNDGSGGLIWGAPGGGSDGLAVNTIASGSGNITLDGTYDVTDIVITANITINALTNFTGNQPHYVRLRQDGTGGHTVTLNTSVVKAGAVSVAASSSPGAVDVLGLMTRTSSLAEVTLFNAGVQ